MNAVAAQPTRAAELITNDAALSTVVPKWRDLAAELGRPAAHPDWVLAMTRRPGTTKVIANFASDGSLDGVMPLRTSRRPWGIQLEPLGAELAEGFAIMARPGTEDTLCYAASALLRERIPGLAAVRLASVASEDQWPRRFVRGAGWGRPVRTEEKGAPYVALDPPTAEAWLETRSKNFRHSVAKAERRLAKSGGEVTRVDAAGDLSGALSAFVELHKVRWQERGGSGVMTPQVEAAVRRASHVMVGSGNLRLWTVQEGGEVVAALLCLAAGATLTTWLGGFDARGAWLQGGLLLRIAAIRDAYALGCRTVDLGTGVTDVKRRIATGVRPVESVLVHEMGVRGAAAGLATLGSVHGRRWKRAAIEDLRERALYATRDLS